MKKTKMRGLKDADLLGMLHELDARTIVLLKGLNEVRGAVAELFRREEARLTPAPAATLVDINGNTLVE